MNKGVVNDCHAVLILMELSYSRRILLRWVANRFFLVDASIPLPFVLLRSGFGSTPTERGDSDLPELQTPLDKQPFVKAIPLMVLLAVGSVLVASSIPLLFEPNPPPPLKRSKSIT